MRTTLDLPDPLFPELKSQAALRGMTLKDLLAEIIADALHAALPEAAHVQRSPLPVVRRAGDGPPISARTNAELQAILDADEVLAHGDH